MFGVRSLLVTTNPDSYSNAMFCSLLLLLLWELLPPIIPPPLPAGTQHCVGKFLPQSTHWGIKAEGISF